MRSIFVRIGLLLLLVQANSAFALDSYRYMHVSFNTLWYIFIGLMVVILFPFLLMAYLAWHYSKKKKAAQEKTN